MYKSGQYLHYLALREDWLEEDDRFLLVALHTPTTTTMLSGAVKTPVDASFTPSRSVGHADPASSASGRLFAPLCLPRLPSDRFLRQEPYPYDDYSYTFI